MTSASPGSLDLARLRRSNNLDALRLLAAFGVVVGHAAVLRGKPDAVPALFSIHVHHLGVGVFFAISGWLIAGSWERTRSVPQFVVSRALRILPLLWLVVLLSTFVLGPAVTTLAPGEYLSDPQTLRYLRNLVLLPADAPAGVFADVPYPGVVNGSVWTLRAEVLCYAAVLMLGLLRARWQTAGFVALGVASAALVMSGDVSVGGASLSAAAGTWVLFAVGALARLHLPRRAFRTDAAVAALVLWWAVAAWGGEQVSLYVSWVLLPYVTLSVGLAGWPVARRAARFGDLSYGLYLFAFPVQQLLLHLGPPLPAAVDVLVVTSASLVLALASWHLVERPALDLRRRLPWFREPATVTPEDRQPGTPPT